MYIHIFLYYMPLLLLLNERVGMLYNVVYTNNVTYFVNYYKSRYPMTIQILLLLLCLLYLPILHRDLVCDKDNFFLKNCIQLTNPANTK